MKTVCFHGTSADALKSIRKNGISAFHRQKIWTASKDAVYMWSAPAIMKAEGCETIEDATQEARRQAIYSAQSACAQSKDCRIIVIKIEIEEDELLDDDSCPNMQGAVYVTRDIRPEEIISIEISNDLSLLQGYFIATMLGRELSNLTFTPLEKKIASIFQNVSLIDELEDFIQFTALKFRAKKELAI